MEVWRNRWVNDSDHSLKAYSLMFPLDIDEKSLNYAKQNVETNKMQGRIKLLQRKPDQSLIPLEELKLE